MTIIVTMKVNVVKNGRHNTQKKMGGDIGRETRRRKMREKKRGGCRNKGSKELEEDANREEEGDGRTE
jgi:hypothetical protein